MVALILRGLAIGGRTALYAASVTTGILASLLLLEKTAEIGDAAGRRASRLADRVKSVRKPEWLTKKVEEKEEAK